MKKNLPGKTDIVVVGARCAGASTAMLLARQGFRVLAIDRGRYGTDTLSTHALMRGGVQQLARWGLLEKLEQSATPPVRTTSFHYGDDIVEVLIKPAGGVEALYAPRRTVLDALLVDGARASGARVEYDLRFVDVLESSEGRVEGVCLRDSDGNEYVVRADLVVGADGLRSSFARKVGARKYRQGSYAGGVIFAYWSGLKISGYHWYYRPGSSAGAIPTTDGLTCVFAAVSESQFREEIASDVESGYRRILTECDGGLASQLEASERVDNFRGFAGIPGFFRQSWGSGWALVGDAGYFRDPITAHGITDALRDAELLSRAAAEGTEDALRVYQETRDSLSQEIFEISDYIASFEWTLSKVQESHIHLSKAMGREAHYLDSLDDPTPFRVSASASCA